jgi:hypothetical protein
MPLGEESEGTRILLSPRRLIDGGIDTGSVLPHRQVRTWHGLPSHARSLIWHENGPKRLDLRPSVAITRGGSLTGRSSTREAVGVVRYRSTGSARKRSEDIEVIAQHVCFKLRSRRPGAGVRCRGCRNGGYDITLRRTVNETIVCLGVRVFLQWFNDRTILRHGPDGN